MKRYLSWSGGKDSTASIIICYENGIHLDGIIMSEVMFDHSRNISGENPRHIDWVYNVAIPIIEKQFGYKVTVLRAKDDYVTLFNRVIKNSRKGNNGKIWGFALGGMCYCNNYLKVGVMKKWKKSLSEPYEDIVGIAKDEEKRLERLVDNHNARSVLAEYNITEEMTYDICRKYNLLSPLYEQRHRGGCWFCPNQSLYQFAQLANEYPNLWAELEKLDLVENKVKDFFAYNKTLSQIKEQIDQILKEPEQLKMFD